MFVRVFIVLAVAGMTAASAGGVTKQPVEGTWAWATGGGSIKVTALPDGTFAGTVVKPAVDSICGRVLMPAGFTEWKLTGNGASYQGTFAAFNSCKRSPGDGEATWTVKTQAGKTRLSFCIVKSGDPPGMVMDPPMCSELLAAGVADTEAPVARAITSQGVHGTTVKLLYNVADNGGKAREQLTVRKGAQVLLDRRTTLHTVQAEIKFSGGFFNRWNAPNVKGALTLCVRAWDAAGNASPQSCARLTLR